MDHKAPPELLEELASHIGNKSAAITWLSRKSKLFDDMSAYDFVLVLVRKGSSRTDAWNEVLYTIRRMYGGPPRTKGD